MNKRDIMNIGKELIRNAGLSNFGRIAVVKQDVHNDLYYQTSPAAARDVVYSSIFRSGPVGLFTALDADFFIVKVDPAVECNSWRQKSSDCGHNPESYYENFRGSVKRYNQDFDHTNVALTVDQIDWQQYDLVISIDIAVPSRIVRSLPRTCWAYYVSEPCMSLYKDSLQEPQFGYDLFLTLGFQKIKPPHITNRVLEFPYFLQYVGCFTDLDGVANPSFEERDCVTIERHSRQLLTEAQVEEIESRFGGVVNNFGVLENLVNGVRKAKYHLRTNGKAIWGNSLVEAATLGAILVGSPKLLKHRLIIDELRANTFDETIELLTILDTDPNFRVDCIGKQEALVNELCFLRPLRDLTEALNACRKSKEAIKNSASSGSAIRWTSRIMTKLGFTAR